ncbi:cellulose binding domain-containing protein [Natronosporangium hydrolyticum]|uniref:Cellulose binding domain-containing protein n=1 Tax=Natronosporangium hydrolyticum TaxID=2811111 RepID=A0A895YM91_9ACTN|nr:cellulose binding domain-containing protein [Natronosporangium hydrolyticum]
MGLAAAATLVVTGAGAGAAVTGLTPAAANVGVVASTAGCGTAPSLTNGTHSISSGGQNRSFILRLPDNYDQNQPYRLIFGFHWLNGNATDVANGGWVEPYYGLHSRANNSAIFVAPQGLDNGWANPGGRDVTFVDDMISQLEADLCVDTTQRFALGFSYGGGMSFALACARPDEFRAVAIYSAGLISGCSGGNSPIAYLQVHGTTDSVLPISGARTMRDRFVQNNGCTPANPPEPSVGSGSRTSFEYSGCSAGHPVAWHVFDGDHDAAPSHGGTQWLPGVTWDFFSQFESSPPTSAPPTTTPPTTDPPTTAPPTTDPPPTGDCAATYETVNSWPGGYQGEVTVQAGTAGISGWTVSWPLASGQSISQVWGGVLNVDGTTATVVNESWNGSLAANGQTTFGFLADGSPSTPTLTCTSP